MLHRNVSDKAAFQCLKHVGWTSDTVCLSVKCGSVSSEICINVAGYFALVGISANTS